MRRLVDSLSLYRQIRFRSHWGCLTDITRRSITETFAVGRKTTDEYRHLPQPTAFLDNGISYNALRCPGDILKLNEMPNVPVSSFLSAFPHKVFIGSSRFVLAPLLPGSQFSCHLFGSVALA